MGESFETFVVSYIAEESMINYDNNTCYNHLNCETLSLCLDWREIYDRKIDCVDGFDEVHCWQLEMNECAGNEYRCHNGQCIPEEFFTASLRSLIV
jgi:hypothetical protein